MPPDRPDVEHPDDASLRIDLDEDSQGVREKHPLIIPPGFALAEWVGLQFPIQDLGGRGDA